MYSKHVQKCTVTPRQNITTAMLHFSVTVRFRPQSLEIINKTFLLVHSESPPQQCDFAWTRMTFTNLFS